MPKQLAAVLISLPILLERCFHGVTPMLQLCYKMGLLEKPKSQATGLLGRKR